MYANRITDKQKPVQLGYMLSRFPQQVARLLATFGTPKARGWSADGHCGYANFAIGVSYEQWLLDPFG